MQKRDGFTLKPSLLYYSRICDPEVLMGDNELPLLSEGQIVIGAFPDL